MDKNIKFFFIGTVVGIIVLIFVRIFSKKENMEDSRKSAEDMKIIFEERYKDSLIDPSLMDQEQLRKFQSDLKDPKHSGLIYDTRFQCDDANDWLYTREPSKALGEKNKKIDTTYLLAPADIVEKQCPKDLCSFNNKYCTEKGYKKDKLYTKTDELDQMYIDMLKGKEYQ